VLFFATTRSVAVASQLCTLWVCLCTTVQANTQPSIQEYGKEKHASAFAWLHSRCACVCGAWLTGPGKGGWLDAEVCAFGYSRYSRCLNGFGVRCTEFKWLQGVLFVVSCLSLHSDAMLCTSFVVKTLISDENWFSAASQGFCPITSWLNSSLAGLNDKAKLSFPKLNFCVRFKNSNIRHSMLKKKRA